MHGFFVYISIETIRFPRKKCQRECFNELLKENLEKKVLRWENWNENVYIKSVIKSTDIIYKNVQLTHLEIFFSLICFFFNLFIGQLFALFCKGYFVRDFFQLNTALLKSSVTSPMQQHQIMLWVWRTV